MSVPDSSTYPSADDVFPVVDGAVTLQTAQHSKLHNLAHSALANIQTFVGRAVSYTGTGELAWTTSVIATLDRVSSVLAGLKTTVGTVSDATTAPTVYGAVNNVSARTGTVSDSISATSAHGKINKINTTIGTSSDAYTVNTLYGKIAAANKTSADNLTTVNAALAQKLSLTGGTLTGTLTANSSIIANGSLAINSSNLQVFWQGSGIFTTALGEPEFTVPLTIASATASDHAVRKDQMDAGLALKANAPGTGQAMLRFTSGQSANPVTVFMGNDPNVLTSNPPVLDGVHTNGSNIQFQWKSTHGTNYMHIDARTGVAGADGVTGTGKKILPVAWAPPEWNRPSGWAVSAKAAICFNTDHDIGFLYVLSQVAVAIDQTNYGNIQFQSGSSLRLKVIDEETTPDYLGFFDAIGTAVFHYRDADVVGAVNANKHHIGFIAEEIEAAAEQYSIPGDIVTYDSEGQPIGLSDRDLVAVLWNVVKDLRNTQTGS